MRRRCVVVGVAMWFIVALVMFHCSSDVSGNGSSSETTNGIIITAQKSQITGSTRPFARVNLYGADYIPFKDSGVVLSAIASPKGAFSFTSLAVGYYSLWATDSLKKEEALFVADIYVPADTAQSVIEISSMSRTGALRGSLSALGLKVDTNYAAYAYCRGSPWYGLIGNSGEFTIGSIASGRYALSLFGYFWDGSKNNTKPQHIVLNGQLTISADSTTIIKPSLRPASGATICNH